MNGLGKFGKVAVLMGGKSAEREISLMSGNGVLTALPYFLQVADSVPAGVKYFWNLWPRHYDYVYILFTTPKTPNPAKKA